MQTPLPALSLRPFPLRNSWHRVGASGSRERVRTLCACMRDLFPAIWIYGNIEEERRSIQTRPRAQRSFITEFLAKPPSSAPPARHRARDRVRSFRAFLVPPR
jgi:hypothetical protein